MQFTPQQVGLARGAANLDGSRLSALDMDAASGLGWGPVSDRDTSEWSIRSDERPDQRQLLPAKSLEEKVEYESRAVRLAPDQMAYRQRLAEFKTRLAVQKTLAARQQKARASAAKARSAKKARPRKRARPAARPKPKADEGVTPQFAD